MNKTIAFLFILAMTAAGVFAVKWQNAVTQMEAEARKAARESGVVTSPAPRPNLQAMQEVQRLESELQTLRVQTTRQRELDAAAHQREIEGLMQENRSLQTRLSNQQQLASQSRTNAAVAAEPVVVVEPAAPKKDNDVGVMVVDMSQYRELNWLRGTLPAFGAVVTDVDSGSPAMIAGIQPGDIIASVGSVTIDGAGRFNETVGELLPGSATQVTLFRNRGEVVVMLLKPFK